MPETVGIMTAMWVDDEIRRLMQRVATRFERLNNMPVKIIDERDLKDETLTSAYFARYYAWQHVPRNVRRIIHFDSDIIPLRALPRLPSVDFAASMDQTHVMKHFASHWPLFKKTQTYFNAGMFIASRRTEALFRRMQMRQNNIVEAGWPWIYDQTMLNIEVQIAAQEKEITFQTVPKSWNNLALIDVEPVASPYMLHLAGMPAMSKMRLIGHVIDHIERAESLASVGDLIREAAGGCQSDS